MLIVEPMRNQRKVDSPDDTLALSLMWLDIWGQALERSIFDRGRVRAGT